MDGVVETAQLSCCSMASAHRVTIWCRLRTSSRFLEEPDGCFPKLLSRSIWVLAIHVPGGSSTSREFRKIVPPAAFAICQWKFLRAWLWHENVFWHFSRNYPGSSRSTTRRRSSVGFHKGQCLPAMQSYIQIIHLPVSCSSLAIF